MLYTMLVGQSRQFLLAKWNSCQGNGFFLGLSPAWIPKFPVQPTFHHRPSTHSNFEGNVFENSPGRNWVKKIISLRRNTYPWHEVPKSFQFLAGKLYLSFPSFPVCKNGNIRFQCIGKKILELGSFCAKSILGLDREIFNKMCFMQLSLKHPQGNLILLFRMKQFNIKIMPAKFRPIL